jgi:hypothetical protein
LKGVKYFFGLKSGKSLKEFWNCVTKIKFFFWSFFEIHFNFSSRSNSESFQLILSLHVHNLFPPQILRSLFPSLNFFLHLISPRLELKIWSKWNFPLIILSLQNFSFRYVPCHTLHCLIISTMKMLLMLRKIAIGEE